MDFLELRESMQKYKDLSSLDVLIAGVTIGATEISPEIIFRFISEANSALQSEEQRFDFFTLLLKGNLKKAKDLLTSVRSHPIKKPRAATISNDVRNPLYQPSHKHLTNPPEVVHKPQIEDKAVKNTLDPDEFDPKPRAISLNTLSDSFSKAKVSPRGSKIVRCPFCAHEIMTQTEAVLFCRCHRQFCSFCLKGPENCQCTKY